VPDPLLVAVVGPTGSGKSDLAIAAAVELDGEIINCDSLQIYSYFDIGTAKLPLSERAGIPHHLLDILDAAETFTAGDYARKAREVLKQVTQRGKLPVIVGGTGFYLRALLEGLFAGPVRHEALRERLYAREGRRAGSLHRLLRRFDPVAAGRIHHNDIKKLVRALEVCLISRRNISKMFESGRDRLEGFRTLKIGLDPPREQLYERLNQRAAAMFEKGLLDEVRTLLDSGLPSTAKPFESIGYAQAIQHLQGMISLPEAIESTRIATRHYAKRQLTWFRREDVYWLHGFGSDPLIQQRAINKIKESA
jgi:tRNA dimethylallyltransferase